MPGKRPGRVSITVRLDSDLAERLRTFATNNAGKPLFATISGIVSDGVRKRLDELEAELARLEGGIALRDDRDTNHVHEKTP